MRVRVDGELWCEGTTAKRTHDIGDMLAYASKGERLDAGDVISTGTMPACCGLELERWIQPGQRITAPGGHVFKLSSGMESGRALCPEIGRSGSSTRR
jgi:2-keto-4-pentenoate hydratase/2-oxohepta-3-ene-1,7-dioic acid hydratase in catechol pathway